MARLRANNVFGTITNNPLLVGGTTLSSAGLANLPVVASPDVAYITLDPNRVNGAPEIVQVTTHTAAATSATINRGREGTVAREHLLGTAWVHAAMASDLALGTLGYAEATANQATISTEVDLTSLTKAVTVLAGRRILITGSVQAESTVANDEGALRIKESTTVLKLAQKTVPNANRSQLFFTQRLLLSPSAGAHTYKLSFERDVGTGTFTIINTSARAGFILVEDVGPDE